MTSDGEPVDRLQAAIRAANRQFYRKSTRRGQEYLDAVLYQYKVMWPDDDIQGQWDVATVPVMQFEVWRIVSLPEEQRVS